MSKKEFKFCGVWTKIACYCGLDIYKHENSSPSSKFTVCSRKTSRRARNNLKRVQDIHEIGILGAHAEQ